LRIAKSISPCEYFERATQRSQGSRWPQSPQRSVTGDLQARRVDARVCRGLDGRTLQVQHIRYTNVFSVYEKLSRGWPDLNSFAEWLSTTFPSAFIQNHEAWVIPTLQSLHIIGIATAIGSALMLTLRVLGLMNMDQTLLQNLQRFSPWLTGAACLLLVTGGLLVIGEPVRELVTFSFWLKMFLVAVLVATAVAFQRAISGHDQQWANRFISRKSVRWAALLTFVIWGCIIILGRLIAYDHIWGHLSPATKA
jgi:hypothetical protein